jgi:hypothetical protein
MNQKGQGMTEYIVIVAIVVGIAVFLFNGPFSTSLTSKISAIASSISNAGGTGANQ